jgi:hypothetical protein
VDVNELISMNQWHSMATATWDDHPGLVSLRPASRHCEEKLDILDIA